MRLGVRALKTTGSDHEISTFQRPLLRVSTTSKSMFKETIVIRHTQHVNALVPLKLFNH